MRLATNIPYLRAKVWVVTAVVAVIDGLDRHVVNPLLHMTAARLPQSVTNVLMNVSFDLMGLASRVEVHAYEAEMQILKLRRLDLDIELSKAHQRYLDIVSEFGMESAQEEDAGVEFDYKVDEYADAVEVLAAEKTEIQMNYGFIIPIR